MIKDAMVPQNMPSDGCTYPSFLTFTMKMMGAESYREFCKEHDFLRRYNVIHWFKSDMLLFRRIWGTGVLGKIRAPIYFIAVVIGRVHYTETLPLPKEWKEYGDYYAHNFR